MFRITNLTELLHHFGARVQLECPKYHCSPAVCPRQGLLRQSGPV